MLLLAAVVCALLQETRCSLMIAYTLNKVSHSLTCMLLRIVQGRVWLPPHSFSQITLLLFCSAPLHL